MSHGNVGQREREWSQDLPTPILAGPDLGTDAAVGVDFEQ